MKLANLYPSLADAFAEPSAAFPMERARFLRDGLARMNARTLHDVLDYDDLSGFQIVRPGKGGAGDLTPKAIAFFVLSYLIDVRRRAQLTEKTLTLARAEYDIQYGDQCAVTGKRRFIDAMVCILTNEATFNRAVTVKASADRDCADIFWKDEVVSTFCQKPSDPPLAESALYRDRGLIIPRLAFLRDAACETEAA